MINILKYVGGPESMDDLIDSLIELLITRKIDNNKYIYNVEKLGNALSNLEDVEYQIEDNIQTSFDKLKDKITGKLNESYMKNYIINNIKTDLRRIMRLAAKQNLQLRK